MPLALKKASADTGIAPDLDDLAALRLYATSGDPRAFELVAARYEAMVLATCRRVLKNQADAEDAAQQAFIKLASHAGRVRSNAAAWLHACAMRTATDIARASGARRRAEARAADEAHERSASIDAPAPEWQELETQLDEALAKLSDADRDLICARFLAGRSQADLAREAGVHAGTLHRRLDKALERLREHLYESGVTLTAVTLVGGLAAVHTASSGASTALQCAVAKIGLSGMANAAEPLSGASVFSSKAIVTAAVGLVLTAGIVGGGAMIMGGGSTGSSLGLAEAAPTAPERPKRKSKPFRMVSLTDPVWMGSTMMIDGDRIRVSIPDFAPDGESMVEYSIVFDAPGLSGIQPKPGKSFELNATCMESTLPPGATFTLRVGDVVPLELELDRIGRFHMKSSMEVDGKTASQHFVAARPAHRDAREFPIPTDPRSIQGAWFETSDWVLTLDKKDITINLDGWKVHRFRIMEWRDAGDHTRIQAIAADSMDPTLVGKRLKLLLQRDGDTYALAYHYHASEFLNEWPTGFDPGEEGNIQVLRFTRAKP
ncbi:MAG: sigma-70 family RNA polymerase sigma factor [Planctomycetota bacterium]